VDSRVAAITSDLERRGFHVMLDQEEALRDRGVYTLYACSETSDKVLAHEAHDNG
jgi:hypothetical protein